MTETEKENELLDFFTQRLKYVQTLKTSVMTLSAVLDSTELEPYAAVHKARVLEKHLGTPGFKETAESRPGHLHQQKGESRDINRICLKMNRRKSCLTLIKNKDSVAESFASKNYEQALVLSRLKN